MSQVIHRCFSVLVGLSKLRHKLSCKTKKLLVEALVFPHIYYCCTVWEGCKYILVLPPKSTASRRRSTSRHVSSLDWPGSGTSLLLWRRWGGSVSRPCWRGGMWLSYESWSRRPTAPPALAQVVRRRSDVSQRNTRCSSEHQLELPKIKAERATRCFLYRPVSAWNSIGSS